MMLLNRIFVLKLVGIIASYASVFWLIKVFSDDYQHRLRALVPELPAVVFDYGEQPKYNTSKVALLIENRPKGVLAPLIVSMMAALPHDWTFRFMGSSESVAKVNSSAAIRRNVRMGRLSLTYIPANMTTAGQEEISTFLTNLWVNEVLLRPAEWLLVYQLDSLFCSKASSSLNEWLDYDWVGAPWNIGDRYGGNGGLSLRKVSSMVEVIRHQQRINHSEPEDVWLTDRLGYLPNAHTANGTESNRFSVESIWHEAPMGYHLGGSGAWLLPSVWGVEDRRQHVWEYCPEMKIIMDLDLKDEVRKSCEKARAGLLKNKAPNTVKMAGPTPLKFDPAIEKLAYMTKNRWRYFRWTPRTSFITFMYVGVFPGILLYAFGNTDGKYNMRGKLRGDTIKEF